EDRPVAVEIRPATVPVVGELSADPVRALDVLDETERTGAENVLLVPVRILRQDLGLVDPVPWRSQTREEAGRWVLEPEDHRLGVGRLERLHHGVLPLARTRHARRRR